MQYVFGAVTIIITAFLLCGLSTQSLANGHWRKSIFCLQPILRGSGLPNKTSRSSRWPMHSEPEYDAEKALDTGDQPVSIERKNQG
ncbi:hypothetical protein ASPVEDRAFT_150244 [Aspergillus versicolor CBS 583.65]|uniref:Secreted protein n=1 Tax=Aspergillus versicolor CBS 583.65 TaxID=1036611 RepID=A0A1L9PIR3_ASPVE|nr:uncharacterized protein ASPVEDRAFT_150244 [Aspergillus versicolor CBS 583.65]OJJ01420.1 hypothetical protein ASPVEDRAFT_150244 [Aspergillus versicolor CBS 583.65]